MNGKGVGIHGPVSGLELRELVKRGRIGARTPVRWGRTEWAWAGEHPFLAGSFSETATGEAPAEPGMDGASGSGFVLLALGLFGAILVVAATSTKNESNSPRVTDQSESKRLVSETDALPIVEPPVVEPPYPVQALPSSGSGWTHTSAERIAHFEIRAAIGNPDD